MSHQRDITCIMNRYQYTPEVLLKKEEVSYYILGAFITDGTCNRKNGSEISSCDYDFLEKIKNNLCPEKPIYKVDNYYQLLLTNKIIHNFLVENECVPNKSLIVKMPNVPDQYFPDFLRGCMDGDGCYFDNHKGWSCEITSASKDFAYAIKEKLIGFNPKIYCSYGKYYKVRFAGVYCYYIIKYMYYNENVLSMDRKRIKVFEIMSYYDKFNFSGIDNAEHELRQFSQGGENNGRSKLTEDKVREIREKFYSGNYTTKDLAKEYNVHRTGINNCISRRTWKNVI